MLSPPLLRRYRNPDPDACHVSFVKNVALTARAVPVTISSGVSDLGLGRKTARPIPLLGPILPIVEVEKYSAPSLRSKFPTW